MSDLSIFYSSMNNVLSQWNDFSVSRNMYKEYFAMQDSLKNGGNEESYVQKLINGSTEKLSAVSDKLNSLSTAVSDSVKKLEDAFKVAPESGETDYDAAYSAAESFVESYNSLSSAIKNSGDKTVSNKSQFIANMTNAYTRKLNKVGITANADGTLSLDKDTFNSASSEDLKKVFGKSDSFASFMDNQAQQLSAYAQTDLYRNANAYSSAGNITNIANISGSFFNMLG